MAKKGISWVFDLVDRVTAPAKKAGAAIDAMSEKLAHFVEMKALAAAPWKIAAPKMPKMGGAGSTTFGAGFGGGMQINAWLELAAKAAAIAQAIGGAAFGMARFALSAASAKTSLGLALDNILGSKAAAAEVAAKIEKLAADTPFEGKDVADSVKSLLAAGYQIDEAFSVFTALGDATAMAGFDPEQLKGMTRAMTKLKGETKLTLEVLDMLNDNSGGMVGRGRVIEQLQKLTGKTREQVQKMISAGQIDAATASKAIQEAIRTNLSGGELGGAMNKMAQEIPGLLSTLQDNLTGALIPSVDQNQGFAAVREMFRQMVKASDRAKPFLQESFGRLFGAVFGGAGGGGQQMFESVLASVGRGVQMIAFAIEKATPYVKAFALGFLVGLQRVRDAVGPIFSALGKAFGFADKGSEAWVIMIERFAQGLVVILALLAGLVAFLFAVVNAVVLVATAVVGAVVAAVGAFSDIFVGFWGALESAAETVYGFGVNIVEGLWAGIQSGWAWMLEQFSSLVELLPASVKAALGIASPSKVFEELGAWTAEGFQVGLEGGQPGVRSAMSGVVAPSVTGGAPGGAGLGGAQGGVSVTVGDIYVNAPAGASPQDVARLVREQLTAQLAVELERLAASAGYAPAEA